MSENEGFWVTCDLCQGTGRPLNPLERQCILCHGTGVVFVVEEPYEDADDDADLESDEADSSVGAPDDR